jgi:probable HAF family extracellular repeat protein
MRRALSTFALAILASSAAFAQSYTVTDLGTLGGAHTEANGIGSLGQIVGAAEGADGIYRAFLYSGRALHDLALFGDAQSTATAINASSQIAGYYYDHGYKAYLMTNGNAVDLGNLGADYAVAWALNGHGDVVGDSKTSDLADHAFVYSHGVMRDLGTFGGGSSTALGINNGGQITGYAYTAAGDFVAFLWQGGTMTRIGTLGGDWSKGFAIDDTGQIVGQAYTAGNRAAHAFLYCGGQMFDLEGLGNTYSAALAINASGTKVVGWSGDHAFLYANGRMQDLNTLIPRNSGWTLVSATGIDDTGLITGTGQFHGEEHAFLLTPTDMPPPSGRRRAAH